MAKVALNGAKKVAVLDDVKNMDFTAARNEFHFKTPVLVDLMTPMVKDQRDLPMLCLLLNIVEALALGVPMVYAINLWQPEWSLLSRNMAGLGYFVTLAVLFQERFILCLHYSSHRNMFHNDALNLVITWIIAPFFGVPAGIYKLHHVVMHHIENNHEADASSTEEFQRDSMVCFFHYWARFVIKIWPDLLHYVISHKKWNHLASVGGGLGSWMCLIYILATKVSFVATLWVFIIPHIIAMSAMSFGNWSQHIFVDQSDRFSNYALTYNCMNTPVNQTTFNDGYHVVHHLNARLHWSEIPQYFYDNREKMYKGGAINFQGVHFMDVGALVMTGQLRKLAEKYYVHIGPREEAPTVEEVEAKLRAWLKPCPRNETTEKAKAS